MMNQKSTIFFLLVMIFQTSFSIAQNSSQKKVQLGLNLKKGDSFVIRFRTNQDISQILMGTEQNMQQVIGMDYRYDVVEANDDEFTVNVTYERIIFNQTGIAGNNTYDSENPAEEIPATAKGFAALVNKSFQMVLTSKGKVREVTGVSKMVEDMVEQFGELDEATRKSLYTSLEKQYGDENTRANMENMMAIYPTKKVRPGDEWTRIITINQGFPLTLETTYKLVSVEGDNANIDVFSKISSDPEFPMEMAGMKLYYEIAGHQEGKTVLSLKNGLTTEATATQDLAGQVTLSTEQLSEDQTWPITMTTTIEVDSK